MADNIGAAGSRTRIPGQVTRVGKVIGKGIVDSCRPAACGTDADMVAGSTGQGSRCGRDQNGMQRLIGAAPPADGGAGGMIYTVVKGDIRRGGA